jgi:hypothetical protein
MPDNSKVSPTVAVGIGGAGCSMISTLHEMTKDEGIDERFRFIGIDSSGGDLSDNIESDSERFSTIELSTPEFFEDDVDDYHYLEPELVPDLNDRKAIQREGAKRERAVGRYYVDSYENFKSTYDRLDTIIEELVGKLDEDIEKDVNRVNIWVMNSLGGGTGSGSFPIISSMLDHIRHDIPGMDEGNFYLYGVGSLPIVEKETNTKQAGYRLNSYAAIRDVKVLTGEDKDAKREIRFGEERGTMKNSGGFDLEGSGGIFQRYFLHAVDEEEMEDDAYAHQANVAAATLPMYFALIDGSENWPDPIQYYQDEKPIYAFESYEMSAPMESMYMYFATEEAIEEIQSEIDEIQDELDRYNNDIRYLKGVVQVDVQEYIGEYCERNERDPDEVDLNDILDEFEGELPDNVVFDMVKQAEFVASGAEYENEESDIDSDADEKYDKKWNEETETDELDNKEVFKNYVYQMANRRLEEEKRDHDMVDIINESWNNHANKLQDNYGHLGNEDAEDKWTGGLKKFLNDKITKREKGMPTWSLLVGGGLLMTALLLLYAHVNRLWVLSSLDGISVTLASITITASQAVVATTFVVSFILLGYWGIKLAKLRSLENEKEECRLAYNEYTRLRDKQEKIRDDLDRLDFNEYLRDFKDHATDLEADKQEKEKEKRVQEEKKETVLEQHLRKNEIELDRKLELKISDEDAMTPAVKQKVKEYVHSSDSIDMDLMDQRVSEEVDSEEEAENTAELEKGDEQGDDDEISEDRKPDSIDWFIGDENLLDEKDVSAVLNKILAGDDTSDCLSEVPLYDQKGEGESEKQQQEKILAFLWNEAKNKTITDAEGGSDDNSYQEIVDEYNRQGDGKIEDTFRVWIMGMYTHLDWGASSEFIDIDERYSKPSGDQKVAEEVFNLSGDADGFVTKRFAYPEFYSNGGHPLVDHINGNFESIEEQD